MISHPPAVYAKHTPLRSLKRSNHVRWTTPLFKSTTQPLSPGSATGSSSAAQGTVGITPLAQSGLSPFTDALKRMEDHLFRSLELQPPARVLDAGCGAGRVAVRLASHGLKVSGIDVVDSHVRWARQEIRACGLESMVDVRLMDYHRLDGFADESFDAVYTMETLVHAIDPEKALGEFFRVMKPGASIALHVYDHPDFDVVAKDMPKELRRSIEQVNRRAAMPSNERLLQGDWKRLLEDQGFRDVVVQDLSENIMPLMRLFYLLARVPYFFICLLGLKARFVNTQAAISSFRSLQMGLGRYVAVTAKKPGSRGWTASDTPRSE